jgi:hypothetical protein
VIADSYIAGSCNIGKGEVRRRQLVALVGFGLSLSVLIGFISAGTEPSMRLGIFVPLAVGSMGQSLSLAAVLTLLIYLLPLS